jgi:tRNA-specific adenosine deaminase 1
MELTMAAQEDATPWAIPPPSDASAASNSTLPGRGYFSNLGIVRRKPSRPDAPSTLSKSCSDKIALKQITSVLSSITSMIISPENAYLQTLTLPESQYVATGCERCFSSRGRLKELQVPTSGGYSFQDFRMMTTGKEFAYSRRDTDGSTLLSDAITPGNIAASWSPYSEETLIGGVRQGRKQNDPRGASDVCKRRIWELAQDIAKLLDLEASRSVKNLLLYDEEDGAVQSYKTYGDIKRSHLLQDRMTAKNNARQTLKGWMRNDGDEGFSLDE